MRARLAAEAVEARVDVEPEEACAVLTVAESEPGEPGESPNSAAAGAAAMAQPIPNATVQPAIRPALVAVARVVGTTIAPVSNV